MRLPKKLSRSLLYVLLVVLSCIIIRDSLIILGVRYRLFVSQNIWLHEGRRKEVDDRNFESENHVINRQIHVEERKLNNKQAPRLRDLPPQERKKRRMEMMRQRQMRRQNRMAAKKQQPVNNNNANGKNNNANGNNNNANGKNNNANGNNNNANGNNNNANGKTNNVNGKNNNANGKNNNKKPDNAPGIKDNSLLEYLKKNPFGFDVKDNQNKFKLVLLLAYPRSGSSFIGQVLSAYNHTMYFFEPLFVIIRQNYDLVSTEIAPTFLDKIFNCEPNITTYLKKKNFVVKSKGELCEAAKVVLVKTIRLRLKVALEWLQLNPEIKVVHLVRDPRGILASMKKGPFREKNTTMQCQYLYEDYQYGKQLHKSRYIRVKYEDFVDHPTKTFKNVFSFLNLPFSNDVEKSVTYHTKAEEMNVTVKAKPKMFKIGTYYSLYRYSDFRHDHTWIKLPKKRLEEIERGCEDVMKALGYHKKTP